MSQAAGWLLFAKSGRRRRRRGRGHRRLRFLARPPARPPCCRHRLSFSSCAGARRCWVALPCLAWPRLASPSSAPCATRRLRPLRPLARQHDPTQLNSINSTRPCARTTGTDRSETRQTPPLPPSHPTKRLTRAISPSVTSTQQIFFTTQGDGPL